MRLILGVLSLLVVLAIVGTVGKKQFEALGLSGQAATRSAVLPGAAIAPTEGSPVPQKAQAIQNHVRDAAAAALQQGAERTAEQAKQ
jgi:hypothetical protein